MQVIKVAYNNVLRRFTISEGVRWEDIAAQIRQLPGISALNGGYTVQYRDAENDLVTIDSDSELADLMRLSTSAIRFEVVPKNASLPSDEQPSFFAIENTEEAVGSADEPEPMATEASEGDASGPKDKQKAPLPDSFAAAFEQILTLIGQFKGMFQDKPEVLARINEFAARLLNVDGTNSEADVQALKRNLEHWSTHIQQHLQAAEGAPWWAKYAQQWMGQFQGQQRQQEFDQQDEPESEAGPSSADRAFYQTRGGRRYPGPYGRGPWSPHHNRSESPMPRETPVPQPEPTPSEIQEKVAQLSNMGFLGDEETLRDMLQRYQGNLERVVEVLVRH